ncbi:MAG: hypothetical protein IT189_08470 [Microbacteriaceae bacterium]|nr:hypothetical protein [Microbacteriaceae bacterium]HQA23614.1 hypothetical protein [Rhodoglobus sp.]
MPDFASELRARLRQIGARPLVVVEGKHDKVALMQFLDRATEVLCADGKPRLLHAYAAIEPHLRNALLFVMDCDGDTPAEYKGQVDLVLTTNRDAEADILLMLDPATRAGVELFGPTRSTADEAIDRMNEVVDRAAVVAAIVGSMLKAARGRGLKVQRGSGPTARAIELLDFLKPEMVEELSSVDSVGELVGRIQSVLAWGIDEAAAVEGDVLLDLGRECRRHRRVNCEGCLIQRSANGHHFVQAIAAMHSSETRGQYQVANVAMVLRTAATYSPLRSWPTLKRIQRWEEMSGYQVLRR